MRLSTRHLSFFEFNLSKYPIPERFGCGRDGAFGHDQIIATAGSKRRIGKDLQSPGRQFLFDEEAGQQGDAKPAAAESLDMSSGRKGRAP